MPRHLPSRLRHAGLSPWTVVLHCLLLGAGHASAAEPDPEVQVVAPHARLELVAEHPQVATPTGIDVDADGNVWVVSCHTHFRPEEYDGPERDEVVVIGPAGRRVFYQRTTATMDLELGPEGWVYLAERSRILRVRDSDGDGRGDQEEDIAVLQTEADYPHNGLAGMAWADDGELIFALGENYANAWTLRGADDVRLRGSGEGGIFRCRPDGTGLRRLARGFWNPFGVCVDGNGELFAVENDPGARPPCRLLHVVAGGDYGYQRLYGPAPAHPFVCWNGELRGSLPMVGPVGEAPCGLAPLGGGLLATSWTEHRIDYHALAPRGASYSAQPMPVVTGGRMFRPTCMTAGEPGVYYFADWVVGSYPIHGRGRVWKLQIDLDRVEWAAPQRSLHDRARRARELRETPEPTDIERLFATAGDEDSFLAHAALTALGPSVISWSDDQFLSRPPDQRLAAGLAAKLALAAGDDRRRPQWDEPEAIRELWVRRMLKDASPAVRFEALRWISDANIELFLPQVEALLRAPDSDFMLFEAALAARNTLHGNPEEGVTDPPMLLQRVRDEQAPARLRAHALRLVSPQHAGLKTRELAAWAAGDVPDLALEAVRSLAAHPTSAARRELEKLCRREQLDPHLRAEAIVGLAAAPDEHWDCLALLARDRAAAVRDEALRALRTATRPEKPEVLDRAAESGAPADLLAAARDPSSMTVGRPELSDLEAWRRRLAEAPGTPDPEAGRRVFFHPTAGMCSQCHRYRGRGHVVGPDLSAPGTRRDPVALLQAILQPSRDVAPEYHPWQLQTDDGVVFTGLLLRDGGGGREVFRDNRGQERTFETEKIVRRRHLETSLMPEKLPHQLTDRELRDLLAFLSRDSEALARDSDAAAPAP